MKLVIFFVLTWCDK